MTDPLWPPGWWKLADYEDEPSGELCAWCGELATFYFDPEPGCSLKAGDYCSGECLLSAA